MLSHWVRVVCLCAPNVRHMYILSVSGFGISCYAFSVHFDVFYSQCIFHRIIFSTILTLYAVNLYFALLPPARTTTNCSQTHTQAHTYVRYTMSVWMWTHAYMQKKIRRIVCKCDEVRRHLSSVTLTINEYCIDRTAAVIDDLVFIVTNTSGTNFVIIISNRVS